MQYLIKIREGSQTSWILAPKPKPAPKPKLSKRKKGDSNGDFMVINPLDEEIMPSNVRMMVRRIDILAIINPKAARLDVDISPEDIARIEADIKGIQAHIDYNINVVSFALPLPSLQQ
ncbi:MAG: hypothetical protein HYV78_01770 [Candidatus Wildermuthbacteria bacterium]|nr:hypothetical protein [Candidatus Wildermuthbacteria bacterium]